MLLCSVPLAELKTLSRKKDMRDFILAEAGNWTAAWIDRILPPLLQGLGKRIRQMAHELHVQEEVRLAIFFVSLLFGGGVCSGTCQNRRRILRKAIYLLVFCLIPITPFLFWIKVLLPMMHRCGKEPLGLLQL